MPTTAKLIRENVNALKTGNDVHTTMSRTIVILFRIHRSIFDKKVWRTSPHTVKGFPVLLWRHTVKHTLHKNYN